MRRWLKRIGVGLIVLIVALLIAPYLIPLPAQPDLDPAQLAPSTGRFITVDGVRTFIEEAGPADGPPIVLVHGFGGLTYTWRYTLPALAEAGYRVLALDLQGFGLSDKSFALDFSHPSQADFVIAVMRAAGMPRATLVGHSMGGSVIAHVAQRHPEAVNALVFVDGAVRGLESAGGQSGGSSIVGVPVQLGMLAQFPPLQRWGQLILRGTVTRERMAQTQLTAYHVKETVTPEVEEAYLKVMKMKDWELALLGVLRDSGRNTLAQPISTLAAPTLILWGERDPWIPLERGEALHAALPQSTLVIIPATGHLPMEEDATTFNAALLEWLGVHVEER
jgi:pimeloyl-ACP methyl ester carboxylesterase